jgi:hypothetical protein
MHSEDEGKSLFSDVFWLRLSAGRLAINSRYHKHGNGASTKQTIGYAAVKHGAQKAASPGNQYHQVGFCYGHRLQQALNRVRVANGFERYMTGRVVYNPMRDQEQVGQHNQRQC